MKQSWTKGLTPELEKEIRGDFKSSLLIRHRLKVLIEDKINVARDNSVAKSGYDIPNWPYKQADSIGYERALKEIIDLIIE